MSFFSGGGQKAKPQYTGLQLQTSSSVVPVTLAWGLNRFAPNIIWYGDFQSHKQKQKAGKGFGGAVTSYTYSASFILGLCQGPINDVFRIFRDQDKTVDYASIGFSLFTGTAGQAPWGYLTSAHPTEALGYSKIAYLAVANYDLGQSASPPQHNFEVGALRYNTGILANGDADPALVIVDLLTDAEFGIGFKTQFLDNDQLLSGLNATTTGDGAFQTYCRAMGFSMSPVLSNQESASSILDRWCRLFNTAPVWTGYSFKFIPYGWDEITANGYHYLPNTEASYTIDENIILDQPIEPTRSDPSDVYNSLKLQINNRDNEYNQAPAEWKDQGLIDQSQLRQGDTITAAEITELTMADTIVSLIGQREAYTRNEYKFSIPWTYCLLEPMDILILIDPMLGVINTYIEDIEEGDDYTLSITVKELPPGIAHAAQTQTISNNPLNTGADPGPVNPPIIVQPPLSLSGIPQVWAAVSGGDGTDFNPVWGGCIVWISTDDATYNAIGRIGTPARQGKLTASLSAYGSTNPDTVNTLSIDLSMSGSSLDSATSDDAMRFATASYVGGEIISYQDVTLTSSYNYDIETLYRGIYGTVDGAHSSGDDFARLDSNIFKYDIPAPYVGLPLYFKFQSFNVWDGGLEDLASCTSYTLTPSGQVPDVPTNLGLKLGGTTWAGDTVDLICDNMPGASSYVFAFYESDGTTLVRTINSPTPTVSYNATQAKMDGAHRTYVVKAASENSHGSSAYSSVVTITNAAPTAVSSVSASGGTTSATVSCTALGSADVSGYVVFFSTTTGFDPKTQGSVVANTGSSIVLYGLAAATYYVRMAAFDPWSSDPSELNLSSEHSFTISVGGGTSPSGGGSGGAGWDGRDITSTL